jgi:hypothetical protein
MIESSLRAAPASTATALPTTGWNEDEIVAAALAATLVAYRRQIGREATPADSNSGGGNWRLVARMEQLQGQR